MQEFIVEVLRRAATQVVVNDVEKLSMGTSRAAACRFDGVQYRSLVLLFSKKSSKTLIHV